MVALSGQVSDDPSGSIEQQTRDVLAKIDRLLELAGTRQIARHQRLCVAAQCR